MPGWAADARYTALVASRGAELLKVALLVAGNRHDAEDAVQEAIIAVSRAWPRVTDRGAYAYLRTAVVRRAIDGRRPATTDIDLVDRPMEDDGFLRLERDRQFLDLLDHPARPAARGPRAAVLRRSRRLGDRAHAGLRRPERPQPGLARARPAARDDGGTGDAAMNPEDRLRELKDPDRWLEVRLPQRLPVGTPAAPRGRQARGRTVLAFAIAAVAIGALWFGLAGVRPTGLPADSSGPSAVATHTASPFAGAHRFVIRSSDCRASGRLQGRLTGGPLHRPGGGRRGELGSDLHHPERRRHLLDPDHRGDRRQPSSAVREHLAGHRARCALDDDPVPDGTDDVQRRRPEPRSERHGDRALQGQWRHFRGRVLSRPPLREPVPRPMTTTGGPKHRYPPATS